MLESLAKLVLINDECIANNIVIHSEDFMKDVQRVVDNEIDILTKDAKFITDEPGPYMFRVANREIFIFSPEHTNDQLWVMISKDVNSESQTVFTFNTLIGLLSSLIKVFKEIENASNTDKNSESRTENTTV